MTKNKTKLIKRQKLRNNEYYNIQECFDELYSKSLKGYKFTNLMNLITREQNILLAYRNIKKNKGSKTEGTNKSTIMDIGDRTSNKLIKYVRGRLKYYEPHSVRRVEIPKENGDLRPLGIPTMEDRIIQQCIKQVLEPICEAKFHNHSYGFRPNRSAKHALARCTFLINIVNLHYVVDIDIKSFFDEVDHGKLLKQMWSIGIRDKILMSIMSKLLKAEIEGYGTPRKGTPQGGIISPLLSNIVLNELDWWISSQWETKKTEHNYTRGHKSRALKTTGLKEMYMVRYADDFKIFCRNHKDAQKIFVAVRNWLKERLKLKVSPEKSKIVNLRKNYSDFLGFKMKVKPKGKKKVVETHISNKSQQKVIKNLRSKIKSFRNWPRENKANEYNAVVLGIHNYFRYATQVNNDFRKINFLVSKCLHNRTKNIRSDKVKRNGAYNKYYGEYNFKFKTIAGIALFPVAGIKFKIPLNFSQDINNYTFEGRVKIHKNLEGIDKNTLKYLMKNPILNKSIEFNDNRISLYVGQNGKCGITGKVLKIYDMEVHHIIPVGCGGTDGYNNLIYLSKDAHKLIHATENKIIAKYISLVDNLDKKVLRKLNKLRLVVGNCKI